MSTNGPPLIPGTRIRLRSLESPGKPAHITRVEEVSDRWLAVQRPTHHYQPVRLYPGTPVEVRVVRTTPPEGIYRAETVVLGETRQRVPLLRLEPPGRWERSQLREYFRVPAMRPVRVRPLQEGGDVPWLEGHTRDLSGGGCQVMLPTALEQGARVEVELELPDAVHRLVGSIQRVQVDPDAGQLPVAIGIKFEQVSERQREEIIRYAFERQIELRRKGMT